MDMGTPFDHFGEEAEPKFELNLLQSGKFERAQILNRLILRTAKGQCDLHSCVAIAGIWNCRVRGLRRIQFDDIVATIRSDDEPGGYCQTRFIVGMTAPIHSS